MKTFSFLALSVIAPFFALSALAASDKADAIVGGYFPEGQLVNGSAVRVQLTDDIAAFHKRFDDAIGKMPAEEQKEMFKLLKPGQPLPFDARFGISKEDYDKYIQAWKKRQIVEIAPIVVGFEKTSDPGIWKVASSTQQGPLPLSTLKYDSNKNIWISPNGELVAKDAVKYDELNNLGAWAGEEWLLQTKDSFSQLAENILIGKTADNKFVYIIYNMIEVTPDGRPTWNESIVLRFPVASASDPKDLREKAKKKAASK